MSETPIPPEEDRPERVHITNRRRGGVVGTVIRAVVVVGLAAGLGAVVAGFGAYVWFARDLPRLDRFEELVDPGVTRFESADGQLVGEWSRERRIALRWDQLPRTLVLAFLAAEDARYFSHTGVDLRGVARAMVTNLRAGSIKEGASTITQQLAKQLVGAERSYTRKVREAILARRMEDLYTKQQILTWYLNAIYLGHGSYGVQAAAQNYFRKDIWDLSLAEAAMLAGLPQSPSRVNPVADAPAAHARMTHVLDQMLRRGWIEAEERDRAVAERMVVHPIRDTLGDHVPFYTEAVRRDVAARYALDRDAESWLDRGLTVHMAVEPAHQRVASAALGRALEALAKKQGYPGPLGRLEQEEFLARVTPWLPGGALRPGDRVLGRIGYVRAKVADVHLSAEHKGHLLLEDTRWAGPYTELPRDERGRTRSDAAVSFKPKLGKMTDAFRDGDIVFVEVRGGEPDALVLDLVPIPRMEGALISQVAHTGALDTLVTGWDFDRSQVNRAEALRQIGSTMKPVVYGKAYDLGLPPSALLSGAPFREGKYNPTGARTRDDILAWNALARSQNAPSLRVLQYVLNHTSLDDYRAWGRALGLPRPLEGHTSEVLGMDQTPMGVMRAFAVFAERGRSTPQALIRKVTDREGRILERRADPVDPFADPGDVMTGLWQAILSPRPVAIPEDTAWLVAANLREVVQRGTGRRARDLGQAVAGKTGTLPYDVWFAGFTGHRTAVAWIGADRRERPLGRSEKVNKVYGGDTALPAWVDFVRGIEYARPAVDPLEPRPDSIVAVRVDPDTGLLRREGGQVIPHRKGTEPTEYAEVVPGPTAIHEAETEF